ncbi:MAG: hypothetical protein JWO36_2052 [Myxococcales bacterium]|nr:hypothetical protein [Myxococcales bacterium]
MLHARDMITTMTRWLVVVCLAACAHSSPPAPTAAAKQPSPCEQLADHLVSFMPAAQHAKPEQLDPFRNLIARRCTDDRWSAEAQQCFSASKTIAEGNKCEQLLTADQAKALELDGQAKEQELERQAVSPPAGQAAPAAGLTAAPPKPAPRPKKPKASSPGASSDPCEGGE